MEPEFWHQKWLDQKIGFHQQKVNSRLIRHMPSLDLGQGAVVFVPLCGKTKDMIWLLEQGFRVLGVELSAAACAQFFEENGLQFETSVDGEFTVFTSQSHGEDLRILAGDVFDLDREWLASIAGVFDRAALVALPSAMRRRYADHLAAVLPPQARILLLTMEYDESKMQGPPFSVSEDEIRSLYRDSFDIEVLDQSSGERILGNLKDRGLDDLTEQVILLSRLD